MRTAAALLILALAGAGCFGGIGNDTVTPKDYLTADDYAKWVIEVDYSAAEQPSKALLDFAKGRLSPLVHKEVEFRYGDSFPSGDASRTVWSDGDVQSFAKSNRDVQTGDGTVVTHLLFLSGHSANDHDNARVLGVTYGHDLIVIFSQSVKTSCDSPLPVPGLCSPDPFFRAVLMHEFGHALGLVDHGVAMVRDHEADTCGGQPDEGHSTNQNSVMYCQVESSAIVQLTTPPTDFDADDKADLRNAGGK